MIDLKALSLKIHSVTVFRDLLCDEVIKDLIYYLDLPDDADERKKTDAYACFVSALYTHGNANLTDYIQKLLFESENVYVKAVAQKINIPVSLEESFSRDLKIISALAALTPGDLSPIGDLPGWETKKSDIEKNYKERISSIGKYGYGIYAKYHVFYLNDSGEIVPVLNPDKTALCDLIDYKREQKIILDNTNALLQGKPAANILLTGDAGTGKSSTIKAVANEVYKEGLRIIEIRKEQLHKIPMLLDELNSNPLKFILFIDDLSFTRDDDNFSALKAILEGSVSAKSNNVAIYATSNRRHLVKESFSDREGDDIHFNDSLQEILSLSERFGIQLTFQRPDKQTYLDIVHNLADKHSIEYDAEKLDLAAERFALGRGTRSARAAKQFIDAIVAGNGDTVI